MHSSLVIVCVAAGLGIGLLCWKSTENWRNASRPGPTESDVAFRNREMIAGFFSIGVGVIGGFAVEFLLLWLG